MPKFLTRYIVKHACIELLNEMISLMAEKEPVRTLTARKMLATELLRIENS